MPKTTLIFIFSALLLTGCVEMQKKPRQEENPQMGVPGPPVIIYKTKSDYTNLVPVQLNEYKTAVISYPAPSDIRLSGQLNKPVELEQGYLFDRRGIGPQSAFLELTFDEYAGLPRTLSPEELFERVLDADPFVVMYRCDIRNDENVIEELNDLIRKINFDRCKQLK